MKSRKYLKDYRLKTIILPNGRDKTVAEYIGGDYVFISEPQKTDKARRLFALLTVVCWLAFAGALLPESGAHRTIYVALPFVCASLPMLFLADSAIGFFKAKEPLTRQGADKISNRLPICSLLTALFTGSAAFAFVIKSVAAGSFKAGDALFCLFAFSAACSSAAMFALRKNCATRMNEK